MLMTHGSARSGFRAESIASHLRTNARLPSLEYRRPVDKAKVVKTGVYLVGGVIAAWKLWPVLGLVLTRRYIWSALSLVRLLVPLVRALARPPTLTLRSRCPSQLIILFMTSGYMWTQIRHPLYVQAGRDGQVTYIASGYQSQLGAEVHIVSALCASLSFFLLLPASTLIALTLSRAAHADGVLGFSVYALAFLIPKLEDPTRQRLGIYVWTGVLLVVAGVLMNVFQMKQPGCASGFRPFDLLLRSAAAGARVRASAARLSLLSRRFLTVLSSRPQTRSASSERAAIEWSLRASRKSLGRGRFDKSGSCFELCGSVSNLR